MFGACESNSLVLDEAGNVEAADLYVTVVNEETTGDTESINKDL
jgi:hypothetical protein